MRVRSERTAQTGIRTIWNEDGWASLTLCVAQLRDAPVAQDRAKSLAGTQGLSTEALFVC